MEVIPLSKEAMMVFGYARVSTDNQLENYSIEEQTSRLQSYCAAKGWTLLHIYIDGGYSGGTTDRPALQEMLRAIRENHVDAVLVYKLDRLSRSQKDTLTLIEDELLAHGTDFVSINENFDTSTPFGRAMIGILSVFAQLEKDQITERFTMGRIGRSKAGYYHGGANAPTGYRYVNGRLEVDEYTAHQVRAAYQMFLAGKSINAIAKHLNENYTTKWTATKVQYILSNSLYMGKVHFRKEEYDGIHQPLIDEKTFRMARALFHSSEREAKKNTAQKNPFRAGYLLSGLVFCGYCGARYSAAHGCYKCYSRSKTSRVHIVDPNCKNDHWRIADLDAVICAQIDALVSRPDHLAQTLKNADAEKRVQVDKTAIRKRISEIERQISKLIDLYQLGTIPMETITARVQGLSEEKAHHQEKLEASEAVPARELFLEALEGYKTRFSSGDTDQKRLLLAALIERVIIKGQSVKVVWRL